MDNAVAVCKFTYTSERVSAWDKGKSKRIEMTTQYDNKLPEGKAFNTATPEGRLEAVINNPAVLEKLKLGEQYYVYLVPVPPKEEAK